MINCGALIHNYDRTSQRYFPSVIDERNVIQVASSDPEHVKRAVDLVLSRHTWGEVNLNCGCPAKSAMHGQYGAVLLKDVEKLIPLCEALASACRDGNSKASLKIRTGIVGESSYDNLSSMVSKIKAVGVKNIVLHARDAILSGRMSPKKNRVIPEIRRDWAIQLQRDHSDVSITFNGGIGSVTEARNFLKEYEEFEGVMLGRAIINDPYGTLSVVDRDFFEPSSDVVVVSREQALMEYLAFLRSEGLKGTETFEMSPLLNFYHGTPAAKKWNALMTNERTSIEDAIDKITKLTKETETQKESWLSDRLRFQNHRLFYRF